MLNQKKKKKKEKKKSKYNWFERKQPFGKSQSSINSQFDNQFVDMGEEREVTIRRVFFLVAWSLFVVIC